MCVVQIARAHAGWRRRDIHEGRDNVPRPLWIREIERKRLRRAAQATRRHRDGRGRNRRRDEAFKTGLRVKSFPAMDVAPTLERTINARHDAPAAARDATNLRLILSTEVKA